ncbi:ribonuclease P/MRP protein subunit POP5 isoform X1 [Scaptodrosophila lebanonensis]|uniref:Ribonuclease P/MRP protein subunit POP5 n=1 Tax=Drosophila lebanonensis TaxID=7225 RepID=A0A6J2U9K4_DROLE|nr:ribonuclease P/MRP protein subunit POP5 isoform X1 [Scaptodrosophila lebanonensis]
MVRIKNRYIAVQIVPYTPTQTLRFSDQTLTKCLLQNVKKYYGVYGLGLLEHGFRVKYCNERTKIAIIRCLHRGQHFVSSMLPLITLIGEVRAKFRTLYTGATIIQCNKFIIKHQRQFLDRMMGQIESAKERQDIFKRVMEFDLDR